VFLNTQIFTNSHFHFPHYCAVSEFHQRQTSTRFSKIRSPLVRVQIRHMTHRTLTYSMDQPFLRS